MTPKIQQTSTFDLATDPQDQYDAKKASNHQRRASQSSSDLIAKTTNSPCSDTDSPSSQLLNSLSNRVTSVISPAIILLVATPIAIRYPLIQLIMFLTIVVGTSPLYFIMITFVGKSNKRTSCYKPSQHQPHRRQPSIVGSIADMNNDKQLR